MSHTSSHLGLVHSAPTQTNLPQGFQWASTTAGIKASGKPDLALALCPTGASAAAMFTSNQVVAAPVIVGRSHLAATGGRVTAVLVNSGNANCATGNPGIDACRQTCTATAEHFGCVFDEVFPSSTGIIGVPLPINKLVAAVPKAKAALGSTANHLTSFADAILTTDTKRKVARATLQDDHGQPVQLFGCAKGAGMIGPQLASQAPHATMLVYLFTDLDANAAQLQSVLAPAVETSFNSISIDGDMSTPAPRLRVPRPPDRRRRRRRHPRCHPRDHRRPQRRRSQTDRAHHCPLAALQDSLVLSRPQLGPPALRRRLRRRPL